MQRQDIEAILSKLETMSSEQVIRTMESIDANGDYRANPAHGIDSDITKDEAREILLAWLADC